MKRIKEIIKWLLLSLITLLAAFAAIALPFKLFELNENAVRYMFIIELIVYFLLSMVYLFSKQKKAEKKEKENQRRIQRKQKFEKAQEEYYSLAA